MVWPSCREHFWVGHKPNLDEEPLDGTIRDASKQGTEGDRNEAERESNAPLTAADACHLERRATDEYDENLNSNLCKAVLRQYQALSSEA